MSYMAKLNIYFYFIVFFDIHALVIEMPDCAISEIVTGVMVSSVSKDISNSRLCESNIATVSGS